MPRKAPHALAVLSAVVLSACGAGLAGSYEDALALWRDGDRAGALARAQGTYEKFLTANRLAEEDVRGALATALERLESTPVPPGAAPPARIDSSELVRTGASALMGALRVDLLSDEATALLRGLQTVDAWALEQEAPFVVQIVFDRRSVRSGSALLADSPAPLRALAVKRAALDVLGRLVLARATTPVL